MGKGVGRGMGEIAVARWFFGRWVSRTRIGVSVEWDKGV